MRVESFEMPHRLTDRPSSIEYAQEHGSESPIVALIAPLCPDVSIQPTFADRKRPTDYGGLKTSRPEVAQIARALESFGLEVCDRRGCLRVVRVVEISQGELQFGRQEPTWRPPSFRVQGLGF